VGGGSWGWYGWGNALLAALIARFLEGLKGVHFGDGDGRWRVRFGAVFFGGLFRWLW